MRYKLLGKSGLRVSEACLGTMTFGETWGWGANREECLKQLDLFESQGGNFIDTSVNYTNGESETILGELLKGRRERFVVATKYTLTRPDSIDPNSGGNSRKNMRQSVERSLKHLRTDYIDVLYLHMWDYMTPVEEVLRGLDDVVSQGKALYVAVSDTPAYIVAEANTLAELRGWARFIGLQIPYSLLDRAVERDLLPMARHWDMAVMPWGILEAGILTGKFQGKLNKPTRLDASKLELSEKTQGTVKVVQAIAQEAGRSAAQVAINWVRQRPGSLMVPILGARSVSQLADNLAAFEWRLNEEQIERLNTASQIDLGFPHGFLEGNHYVFGATFKSIDNHHV